MSKRDTTPVCVAIRGRDVIVYPTTSSRQVLPKLNGTVFHLSDMLEYLVTGRSMTKWEKRLRDQLVLACGQAEISVSAGGFVVTPLPAVAGEITGLQQAVAQTLRQHLETDGWHIVSGSCQDASTVLH